MLRTSTRPGFFRLFVLVVAVHASAPLLAAEVNWLSNIDGTFSDSAQWSGGVAPSVGDDVFFETGGSSYSVDFSGDTESATAFVRDTDVTWDLAGSTYTLTGADGLQVRGEGVDRGSLLIKDGTLVTTDFEIGNPDGKEINNAFIGEVTLDNASVQAQSIGVGRDAGNYSGPGTLLVTNQSSVIANSIEINSAGTGTGITVDGAGSSLQADFLSMFRFPALGGLNLHNSATATVGDFRIGGGDTFTRSSITTGATLNIDTLRFSGAQDNQDRIDVDSGGSVITESVDVGSDGTFFGTISGAGSSWINNGDFIYSGKGQLSITDQGQLINHGKFQLGKFWGFDRITVDGAGSKWTNGNEVTIGDQAFGRKASVTVSNGGEIDASGQTITLNPAAELIVDNGTIKAKDIILSGGSIAGSGDIQASVFNGSGGFVGLVSPGMSPGVLNIDGAYHQDENGTLFMEIAGLTAGAGYDVLNVSRTAYLDGTLEIVFLNDFTPEYGDEFDLLKADVLSGTFDTLLLPDLDGGLFWRTGYIHIDGAQDVFRASVVPIPASVWLFGSGLGLLGWLRRRRLN